MRAIARRDGRGQGKFRSDVPGAPRTRLFGLAILAGRGRPRVRLRAHRAGRGVAAARALRDGQRRRRALAQRHQRHGRAVLDRPRGLRRHRRVHGRRRRRQPPPARSAAASRAASANSFIVDAGRRSSRRRAWPGSSGSSSGLPEPAAQGRLPRDRHARLRRDLPPRDRHRADRRRRAGRRRGRARVARRAERLRRARRHGRAAVRRARSGSSASSSSSTIVAWRLKFSRLGPRAARAARGRDRRAPPSASIRRATRSRRSSSPPSARASRAALLASMRDGNPTVQPGPVQLRLLVRRHHDGDPRRLGERHRRDRRRRLRHVHGQDDRAAPGPRERAGAQGGAPRARSQRAPHDRLRGRAHRPDDPPARGALRRARALPRARRRHAQAEAAPPPSPPSPTRRPR